MGVENIYICATLHHVLITMIKQLHSENRSDIVLCSDIPDTCRLIGELATKHLFENVYFFDRESGVAQTDKGHIWNFFYMHHCHIQRMEEEWKVDLRRYKNIFIFNDTIALGMYLQEKKLPYHLVEDGLNAFQVIDKYTPNFDQMVNHPSIKRRISWAVNYGYRPWGQSKWCIDIEVNEKKNLKIPDHKVFEQPKEKLYDSLTAEEKQLIYHTFVQEEIPTVETGEKLLLLLTQPLAVDSLVANEEVQCKVYRDIVRQYGEGYRLIVKPHPRDSIDYKKCFPDAVIIDARIPTEIMNFNNKLCFDRAITIESSSIQSLQCVKEKKKIGIEILKKYQ